MFIYHFNRMIRSRILWLVFAIVIAVAFLSVDSCSSSATSDAMRDNVEGRIGSRDVLFDEYDSVRTIVEGMTRDLSPAATETQIWTHIAAMEAAKEMGISVTEREIAEAVSQNPMFWDGGVFSKERYREAIGRTVYGAPAYYERALAHQLLLGKLFEVVSAPAALVPKMELDLETASQTDTFKIKVATMANTNAQEEVAVDDSAIMEYYAAHKEEFALPDRVSVRYATLPVSNFVAYAQIDDVDARDYYDADPSRYSKPGTNGTVTAAFEEVKEEIVALLAGQEAVYMASTNLMFLMDEVASDTLEDFTAKVSERGFATSDTALFAVDSRYIPGIEPAAAEEFAETARDLDLSANYCGIARGRDNVYLMRIVTNSAAHVPALETLRETIRPLVRAEKKRKAFEAYTSMMRDSLAERAAKDGLEKAASSLGISLSTSVVFKVSDLSSNPFENSSRIAPEAIKTAVGAFSKAADIYGGAAVAYVEERTQGDVFGRLAAREGAYNRLKGIAAQAFFAKWMEWNLSNRTFASRRLTEARQNDADETD